MLDTLKFYFRIYFQIEAQYIKSRMQYRDDFIISTIGMLFSSLTTVGVFWVIFDTVPELDGWSLNEIIFIYSFYLLATNPMQTLFDHFWQLRIHVLKGTFIKYYFRPLNMMFYYVSEMFDVKGIMQLFLGIALFVYSSNSLGLVWNLKQLIYLIILLLSASLVIISIMIVAASASFWIYNSFPVMDLAWRLREYAPYPMSIYKGFFQILFTYVIPIGFISFYPSQVFIRPEELTPIIFLSPAMGIIFSFIAYRVWTAGVNSYTGTGS